MVSVIATQAKSLVAPILVLSLAAGFAAAQTITTVAGSGLPNAAPATSVAVHPAGMGTDQAGNLYFNSNSRVFKVSPGGTLTIVAGNGIGGFSGDGGPAASAQIVSASGVAVDTNGNVFIADFNRIRKVSGGIITTVATPGAITSLAIDPQGNLFAGASTTVLKISGGNTSVVAGGGTDLLGDGGPATTPAFRA